MGTYVCSQEVLLLCSARERSNQSRLRCLSAERIRQPGHNLSSKPEARGCAHTESARMRNGHINDHQVRTELQGRPPSAIDLPSSRPLKGPFFVCCHRRVETYGWIYVVGREMFSQLTVLACTRVDGRLGLDQSQHLVPGIVRSLTAGGLGLGPGEVGFVVSRPLGRADQRSRPHSNQHVSQLDDPNVSEPTDFF